MVEQSERGPAYNFWSRVKSEQAARGWTDSELFRQSKVTRNTINGLKTRKRVEAVTVNRLADALDIPRSEAHRLAGLVPDDEQPDTEAADARDAILRDPVYNEEQRAAMLQLHDLFARANRDDS